MSQVFSATSGYREVKGNLLDLRSVNEESAGVASHTHTHTAAVVSVHRFQSICVQVKF